MKNLIFTFLFAMSFMVVQGQSSYKDFIAQGKMNNQLVESLNNDGLRVSANAINGKYVLSNDLSVQDIVTSINKISNTEFKLKQINESRLTNGKKFHQFNQFYNDIRIEGGFISIVEVDNQAIAVYPKVFDGLSINTLPSFSLQQIESQVIKQSIDASELVISPRFGNYSLVWKVSYMENYIPKEAWVNASTGEILDVIERIMKIEGQTQTYGTQNLNDNTQGGVTTMETPGQDIRLFDGTDGGPCNWDESQIPSTTNTASWAFDATDHCIQAFHAATEIVPTFGCLGIDFGTVNVDCSQPAQNAFSLSCSTVDNAYVTFGTLNGSGTTLALYDVMGHELGHTYLNQFLDYTNPAGNAGLHEGIADIFGTYTESKVSGLDWVMGDDEPEVANLVRRDLSQPFCLANSGSQHTNGLAMGHWSYLMTEGDAGLGIDPIGLQAVLELIIDALPNVGPDADFAEMSSAILDAAVDEYGSCSTELQSLINAFTEVCITPDSIPQPVSAPTSVTYQCVAYSFACIVIDGQQTYHPDYTATPVCVFSPNGTVVPELVITSRDDPSCSWTYENVQVPACNPGCPGYTPTVEYVCTGNGFESCALIDGVPTEDSPWQIYPDCNQYSYGQDMQYNLVWKADPSCNLFFDTTLPDCSDQVPCEEPELTILCNIFGEACLIVDGQSVPNATWGIYGPSCVNTDWTRVMNYHIYDQSNTQCEFLGSIQLPDCGGFGGGEGLDLSDQRNDISSNINDILLSPNPAIDVLNVAFENEIDGTVQIFDVSGKLMFKKDMKGSKLSIDLSQMNAGMYFISVNDDLGRYSVSKKFIKARF